jgi:hypothetical protein
VAQSSIVGYCQEDKDMSNGQHEPALNESNALQTGFPRDLDPKLIGHNTEDLCIIINLLLNPCR